MIKLAPRTTPAPRPRPYPSRAFPDENSAKRFEEERRNDGAERILAQRASAAKRSRFRRRPVGQEVKTPPFHGGNTSSILVRVTSSKQRRTLIIHVVIGVFLLPEHIGHLVKGEAELAVLVFEADDQLVVIDIDHVKEYIYQPLLLIADEPTTALDVTIQAQVLVLMEELKTRLGTSMIMISHDLGVVAKTCDSVAVMYAGEIIEYGTARDIFEGDRHHPYTVGLFRAIPDMNEETRRLQPILGLMPDPSNLPPGCKFHPRCPQSTDECREGKPYLYEQNDHRILCNLFRKGAAQ